MNISTKMGRKSPLAVLGRMARSGTSTEEQCDFCSVPLAPIHRHLLEVASRKVVCVCDACGLRFPSAKGRYRLIPRDARAVPDFRLADDQWEALALPINLAFIFRSTAQSRAVALYPSPAGVTESLLTLQIWGELTAANPALAQMEPDVEALLVNRIADTREYFIAPIDLCFELAGLIRVHWRGLSGGEKVWQEIETFFGRLRTQAGTECARPPAQPLAEEEAQNA